MANASTRSALIATTSVPYYVFTTIGSYTVKVTSSGCTSALSQGFTPTTPTGIKNSSNSVKLFEVYPNPTEGRLVLNLNLYKTSSVNVSIYTPEGREVYVKAYGNTKALTEELNINKEELEGSAWEAAITSFVLFALDRKSVV